MYTTGLALTVLSLLSRTASAAPTDETATNIALEPRNANTFKIHVWNNCPFPKSFALYQILPTTFEIAQKSPPTTIAPQKSTTINAPYNLKGMRLSGHAEWPIGDQWKPQALFEFGPSSYMGAEGTAYDLSVMEGSDRDIGIGVYPVPNGRGSRWCESKTCFPWHCPAGQGWTNPDQMDVGSPADTVCYKGKTDFKVVFCP